MFKQAAFILAAALAAGGAFAQGDEQWVTSDRQAPHVSPSRAEVRAQARAQQAAGVAAERGEAFDGEEAEDARSTALRYQVVADTRRARAAGTWPLHDYEGAGATVPRRHPAARPRKEYPNVMGISFQEWLASHP